MIHNKLAFGGRSVCAPATKYQRIYSLMAFSKNFLKNMI